MIKIYKELIKKYINKLTIEDIKKYALKQNETLTIEEANIIYSFIKNNYQKLLNKNPNSLLPLKQHLRKELFNKIEQLYNENIKYI